MPFAQLTAAANQTLDAHAAAAAVADAPECPWSGGWSLQLLARDVLASPRPFMQLQIAALSCDRWVVVAAAAASNCLLLCGKQHGKVCMSAVDQQPSMTIYIVHSPCGDTAELHG
jgi:hypothetical protein